jgi:hypothetical protein
MHSKYRELFGTICRVRLDMGILDAMCPQGSWNAKIVKKKNRLRLEEHL